MLSSAARKSLPDPPVLVEALRLLALDLWPVPISPHDADPEIFGAPGKQPMNLAGGKDRWGVERPTAAKLVALYRKHPTAGVGLLLGPQGGVVDLEVDEPDTGPATFDEILAGEIIPTMSWTSSRGPHRIFRWNDRFAELGKAVVEHDERFPGLSLRLGGGKQQVQSVCPPSPVGLDLDGKIVAGAPRAWIESAIIAELPEPAYAEIARRLAMAKPSKTKARATPPPPRSRGGTSRYGAGAMLRELEILAAAQVGGRNDQFNRSCFALGQLVGGGELDEHEARSALMAQADRLGLGDAEILATTRSGMEAGKAEPRSRPEPEPKRASRVNLKIVGEDDGQAGGDDADLDEDEPITDPWPIIDPQAFHGLAGELVNAIDPHTEGDPAAVLAQFIIGFASMIGRKPHFNVGATTHHLNMFALVVGGTASGRKGSGWDVAKWLLKKVDPIWTDERCQGGLVSGEGLIYHVRDAVEEEKDVKGERRMVLVDAGVADKRLLIVETEMSRAFKAASRETNTLTDVIRQAWDSGHVRTMARNNPVRATDAHVSIIGHTTASDAHRHLSDNDAANGFANRFLWIASRQSKLLPDGGAILDEDWDPLRDRLRDVAAFARETGEIRRDHRASLIWKDAYERLNAGHPGLLGAILNRAAAQTVRLSCIYALLDKSNVVGPEHLNAALALWQYAEDSARYVFGDKMGDPDAEKLLAALRQAPDGLTRKQITGDVFQRHKRAPAVESILRDLLAKRFIHHREERKEVGRPTQRWFAGGSKS